MIGLISINYKKASLKVRDSFAFTEDDILQFNTLVRKKMQIEGLFILSTCNRTELYYEKRLCEQCQQDYENDMINLLVDFKNFENDLRPYILSLFDEKAVSHFFGVASGLQSLVFGEYQIVKQIKDAHAFAKKASTIGAILDKMVQKSLETGKNVRTLTGLNKGAMSVSSAAVEIALQRFKQPEDIRVLSVGTGETGQLLIESLKKKSCHKITLANRTWSKAQEIAQLYQAECVAFDSMYNLIPELDMIVFSTASPKALLDKEVLMRHLNKERQGKLLLIDLGVPRNINPDVEELEQVELFNLDKLNEVVAANTEKKKQQYTKANTIINAKLDEFKEWLNTYQLKDIIGSINQSFQKINKEQLKRLQNSENKDEIEAYGDALSNKMSNMLIKKLKKASKNGLEKESLQLIEELFLFEV